MLTNALADDSWSRQVFCFEQLFELFAFFVVSIE